MNNEVASSRSFFAMMLLGTVVLLIALNLRTVFSSLPVLLPDIVRDLGLTDLHSGNLTTLPTLCLGLFAPFVPFLVRQFGMEKTIIYVLIVLAIGLSLRGVGTLTFLYSGGIIAAAAIAIANVLLPALVKRDFSHHLSLMTALYTMGICGGAAIAAAATVPLQQNLFADSWQLALGIWALPVILVVLLWLPYFKKNKQITNQNRPRVKDLWNDALAWQITLMMGFQSSLAYIGYGWMAPILHERGVTPQIAGNISSISILAQVLGCLIIPMIIGRHIRQSGLNVTLSLIATAGFIGLYFVPLGGFIWFFAALQGFGQGGMLAASMMVIVLRSRDAHVAAHLASMAQSIGYCVAAFGPFALGFVRENSGSLNLSAIVPLGVGLALAFFGFLAGRPLHCKAYTVERE